MKTVQATCTILSLMSSGSLKCQVA